MDADNSKPEIVLSEDFNDESAEVLFQSSDGLQLRIHRKNLEATTGAFPPSEIETRDEVVHLTETGKILELLFCFIYPRHYPILDSRSIRTLASLAEAAEKYEVFPAMAVCRFHMKSRISMHPRQVLAYSTKHGIKDLADAAAPLAIEESLTVTVAALPTHMVLSWAWTDVVREVCVFEDSTTTWNKLSHPHFGNYCGNINDRARKIQHRLGNGVRGLLTTFPLKSTDICCSRQECPGARVFGIWSEFATKRMATVPKFNNDAESHIEIRPSTIFNDLSAEIVIQSNDGLQLRIHQKNIDTSTGSFPYPESKAESKAEDQVIHLQQAGYILELLFQFIYPKRHPELDSQDTRTMTSLADAAEEYQVFPVMSICLLHMKAQLHQHPRTVLVYATKYEYFDLADLAAPLVITEPLTITINSLPTTIILPWLEYHEKWAAVASEVCTFKDPRYPWSSFSNRTTTNGCAINDRTRSIYQHLGNGVRGFLMTFPLKSQNLTCCGKQGSCEAVLKAWNGFAEGGVANVPKFSELDWDRELPGA